MHVINQLSTKSVDVASGELPGGGHRGTGCGAPSSSQCASLRQPRCGPGPLLHHPVACHASGEVVPAFHSLSSLQRLKGIAHTWTSSEASAVGSLGLWPNFPASRGRNIWRRTKPVHYDSLCGLRHRRKGEGSCTEDGVLSTYSVRTVGRQESCPPHQTHHPVLWDQGSQVAN